MVLQPDPPFPKGRGNTIRSEDWNETVNEVVRLDAAKLNQTGGTVSGNLAVTGTITGRLADNAVGHPQLADNAVSGGKIAPSTIHVEKFLGEYHVRNMAVTVGTAKQEFAVEHDFTLVSYGGPPDYFSHPVVFVASSTPGASFEYWLGYRSQRFPDSSFVYGWHTVVVQNRSGFAIQLHITSYIHRLTPVLEIG